MTGILEAILFIADFLLWLFMAGSVVYVCFFAVASLFYRGKESEEKPHSTLKERPSFLVLYPAYHEDAVILHSVHEFLRTDYPNNRYRLAVISDHMTPATNDALAALPLTLLQPQFEKSSKAKALQYAIQHVVGHYDYVVILDADNVVHPDFLTRLETLCAQGYQAIQCHRTAKNSDNDIAVLDGVSEEINNSLFRRAHNAIGLSSALIGSGMCFRYEWFRNNVGKLSSAVEDRELETQLAKQKVFVKYADDIYVLDEKVSNADTFQRQRLRWMTGQVQTLLLMLPYLPKAILTGNLNYVDKTLQQLLIPRSILIVALLLLSLLSTIVSFLPFFTLHSPLFTLKWWLLFLALCLSLVIALPRQLRKRAVLGRVTALPHLVWRLVKNIFQIDHRNTDFIHTTHTK